MNLRRLTIMILLFWFALPALSAFADERTSAIKTETTESRFRLGLLSNYTALNYSGAMLTGVGIGLNLRYAISDIAGLMTSFTQAFYTSATSFYSAVDFRFVYAITGSLITRKEKVEVSGHDFLSRNEYNAGGLRAMLQSDLYFVNSLTSVISFTGAGLGLSYEFPSKSDLNWNAGVRADYLTSSRVQLTPIQVFIGVLF